MKHKKTSKSANWLPFDCCVYV